MASRKRLRRLDSESPITDFFATVGCSNKAGNRESQQARQQLPLPDQTTPGGNESSLSSDNSELLDTEEVFECETKAEPERLAPHGSHEHKSEACEHELDSHADSSEKTESFPKSSVCNLFCYTSSEIYQPTDVNVLKKTERIYGSGSNACTSHFLPSWYKTYPWLHFCCTTLKVYCHYCMMATELNVRISKADPALSTNGFCNWKKAVLKFKEHECSLVHQHAVVIRVSHQRPINQQLQKQLTKVQQNRRCSLVKQISALRYVLRQGLAIRNDHAGGSNLTVLLQMVLDEDRWVQESRYQSPEIVNELIEIMANDVLRSMLASMFRQHWFALLADETRDISNRKQLVLFIIWVSDYYEISEDFVELIQLSNTTAETIHKSLKVSLMSLGFQFENCRRQGYDGASNFQGFISGFGKLFQDENPAAIYTCSLPSALCKVMFKGSYSESFFYQGGS